ncbi:hypothetical protein ACFLV7_14220, partial [Chloroflexota bacterium]
RAVGQREPLQETAPIVRQGLLQLTDRMLGQLLKCVNVQCIVASGVELDGVAGNEQKRGISVAVVDGLT